MKLVLRLAPLLMLPTAVLAQVIETPSYSSETVTYRCAGGNRLAVAYLNLRSGESIATLYLRGGIYVLHTVPAASGVRYVTLDEQAGYRWMTKGDEGTLLHLAADHTAQERVLRKNCRRISK